MKELLKQIKKYDKITIFRHINPDGDCVFSALALKSFLNDNFKDKQVKISGIDVYDLKKDYTKVSNKFIEDSLAIIVDVSNPERVDDNRFLKAKYIIKIDHHPAITNFGNLNYVNDKAAATCEYLTEIFTSKEFSKFVLSKKTREYLYCGILTDSLNFKTTSTTSKTLKYASLISEDLDVAALSNYVFEENYSEFEKSTKIRNYLVNKNHLGCIILNLDDLKNLGLTSNEAKNRVGEFGIIKELNIWFIAAINKETNLYDVSLRSKGKYIINSLARVYGGGGHDNASGIKNLTKNKLDSLIKDLEKIANKK